MKSYKELLPSYLTGPNIQKHANIINNQDQKIHENIQLLTQWNRIERPILIERVQEQPGKAIINIHINSPFPIKKIITTGLKSNIDQQYDEEELITNTIISITCTDSIPPVMPEFVVTVETYVENISYEKGYPENDIFLGNNKDHDIFLDNIGLLMGIPRRVYIEQNIGQNASKYEQIYPAYFTKTMFSSHQPGDPLTEDDYYYMKRLNKYLQEKNTKSPPLLMAEILYEFNKCETYPLQTRKTSITPDLEEYIGTATTLLTHENKKYLNIDYTNIDEKISQYNPITRNVLLKQQQETQFYVVDIPVGVLQNEFKIIYGLYDSEENFIDNAPLTITTPTGSFTIFTEKNNFNEEYQEYQIDLPGLSNQNTTYEVRYEGEYEFLGSDSESFTASCDGSYNLYYDENEEEYSTFKYSHYSLSSISSTAPRMNHDGYLSVGRGVLCYTPGIYIPLIPPDKTVEIEIFFRYGSTNCQIGLTRMVPVIETEMTWDGVLTVRPATINSTIDYTTQHVLKYVIDKENIKIYMDEEHIKEYPIRKEWQLLHIAGYNGTAENDTNNRGLYIEDAQLNYIN